MNTDLPFKAGAAEGAPSVTSLPFLSNTPLASATIPIMAEEAEAVAYLNGLLNRTLHLHTTDGRMFVGQMKCTDNERNIILAMTHEYRQPSQSDVKFAAERHERMGGVGNVKVDMKKRFVGLVVVPGQYITKIELESFA